MPASSLTLVSPAVYDVIVLDRLSELLVVGAICGCACCLHTVTGVDMITVEEVAHS